MTSYDWITIGLVLIAMLLTLNSFLLIRIRRAMTTPATVNNVTFTPPERPSRPYKRDDRVRVMAHGWNAGAHGTVEFQEPNGKRCWVIRDGSDGPVWYMNHELEPEAA